MLDLLSRRVKNQKEKMNVVLVPRRADGGYRDQLWKWCAAYWQDCVPWPVYVGMENSDEPFNRSKAINIAASTIEEPWDVAAIIDADVYAPVMQMTMGAAIAANYGACIPYRTLAMVDKQQTLDVLAGKVHHSQVKPLRTFPSKDQPDRHSVGGLMFVRRDYWDEVGGMDERFVGWGEEDRAFELVLRTMIGHMPRASGTAHSLWHPKPPDKNKSSATYRANAALYAEYQNCARSGGLIDWVKARGNAASF